MCGTSIWQIEKTVENYWWCNFFWIMTKTSFFDSLTCSCWECFLSTIVEWHWLKRHAYDQRKTWHREEWIANSAWIHVYKVKGMISRFVTSDNAQPKKYTILVKTLHLEKSVIFCHIAHARQVGWPFILVQYCII